MKVLLVYFSDIQKKSHWNPYMDDCNWNCADGVDILWPYLVFQVLVNRVTLWPCPVLFSRVTISVRHLMKTTSSSILSPSWNPVKSEATPHTHLILSLLASDWATQRALSQIAIDALRHVENKEKYRDFYSFTNKSKYCIQYIKWRTYCNTHVSKKYAILRKIVLGRDEVH